LGSYFHCSYATSPNKYEFKKWLTTLIRSNLMHKWLSDTTKEKLLTVPKHFNKDKNKKIVVMLEHFMSNHAMTRCFQNLLQELAKNYTLIAISRWKSIDEASKTLFEEVYIIEDIFGVSDNVDLVLKIQPDIILYPSIGMQLWTICLSQLRLAPKQIMMGGHPSSSFSPYIDGFIMTGDSFTAKDIQPYYMEKVILNSTPPENIVSHTKHDSLTIDFISTHNQFNSNVAIKVGINGILTKVTERIISLCKQISVQSKVNVTFVFFTGATEDSVQYLSAFKQISKVLTNFELDEFKGYTSYMEKISECHFLLPTLPFGGTNSNIDAAVLCKPKLFIRGNKEIYTRCDEVEWRRLGLEVELGCDNDKELVDKAVALTLDANYRKELYDKMKSICTVANIFDDKSVDKKQLLSLMNKAIF